MGLITFFWPQNEASGEEQLLAPAKWCEVTFDPGYSICLVWAVCTGGDHDKKERKHT
jgi:hypothetical protein